jgi:hypothetical protein
MKKQILWITCILALAACEKDIAPEPCQNPLDPNCVTYHPCNGVQPVTADFEMWRVYYSAGKLVYVEQDSVFPEGLISFKAKLNGATYKWQLGLDTVNVKQVERYFNSPRNDSSMWGTYYNTLTVWKTPDSNCFPNDKPTSTLTRSITIQRPSKLLTSGIFKVVYEGDMDSTIIQVQPWATDFRMNPNFSKESNGSRALIGFKGVFDVEYKSDTVFAEGFVYGNKKLLFIREKAHLIYLPYNGEITINPYDLTVQGKYDILLKNLQVVTYRFKGRKL